MVFIKKKILYVCHVDWDWIKQRPQFIAEELNNHYEVYTLYKRSNRRKRLVKNPTKIKKIPIFCLPFERRLNLFYIINSILYQILITFMIFIFKPDYIWLTHPNLLVRIPKSSKAKIIYDCMDDYAEFDESVSIVNQILKKEKFLLNNSEKVITSSENLKNVLINRGCNEEKIFVVRNGFKGKILPYNILKDSTGNVFKIAYIGTIAKWMDFDTILNSLTELKNVEFHFFGPSEVIKPAHDRIIFHGVIPHENLGEIVKEFDCFVMPFKLNRLIKSVDPVKLYEYINFNKNIISVYYEEIKRFDDFVYFYNTKDEFTNQLRRLIVNNKLKFDEEQKIFFLSSSGWESRGKEIQKILG